MRVFADAPDRGDDVRSYDLSSEKTSIIDYTMGLGAILAVDVQIELDKLEEACKADG